MSLRWYYRPSWRPTSEDPPVEFTDHVRLYTVDVAEGAEEGNSELSQIVVDDDDAEFTFPPLTRVWAVETEAAQSSNTYAYHGYITARTFRRGPSQLTSSARVIELNMADENSVLSRRVLSNPNANRPAETDVARVQWLANEADGQLLIDETTFLSTASPVAMDAADYRGQTAKDVLDDAAQASGKNYFAYFNQNVGTGIWYGAEDLALRDSMIRLSNVLTDFDETQNVYMISEDTALTRDPSRLLSGVYYQYTQGATYVRNQSMFSSIGLRDLPYSSLNVKTLAKATARANRYLADNDSEDDRIVTSVLLPRAKSTWLKAGYRVRFRASHLPGYEDEVWLRVYRCSYSETESEEWVRLTLELGTNAIPPAVTDIEQGPIGQTVSSATLTIGSASLLGLGADREKHYGSDVGVTAFNPTVGKQYRIRTTILFNLDPPTYGNDHVFAFGSHIYQGNGTTNKYENPPLANNGWAASPVIVDTDLLNYDSGISWTVRNPVRDGGTAPNNSYAAGQVIEGQWATYGGPNTSNTMDICLVGSALSGFFGFEVIALVELQERDAP